MTGGRIEAAARAIHALAFGATVEHGSWPWGDGCDACTERAIAALTAADAVERENAAAAGVSLPPTDEPRRDVFVLDDFTMHSGATGHWKIECDALTDGDIECLAEMLAVQLPDFAAVIGVAEGGNRIAAAMDKYRADVGPYLIVDDVLTTGASMEDTRRFCSMPTIGAVLFARGPCPSWVTPLFSLNSARAGVSLPPTDARTWDKRVEAATIVTQHAAEPWTAEDVAIAALRAAGVPELLAEIERLLAAAGVSLGPSAEQRWEWAKANGLVTDAALGDTPGLEILRRGTEIEYSGHGVWSVICGGISREDAEVVANFLGIPEDDE